MGKVGQFVTQAEERSGRIPQFYLLSAHHRMVEEIWRSYCPAQLCVFWHRTKVIYRGDSVLHPIGGRAAIVSFARPRELVRGEVMASVMEMSNDSGQCLSAVSTCWSIASEDSDLPVMEPLSGLAAEYFDLLLQGRVRAASGLILDAVEEGTNVRDVYLNVFQRSLTEIGRLWQLHRVTVAQEHLFSAATQLVMAQLYTHVRMTPKNGKTLVAVCVQGNLHEIGCRMLADLFAMDGWNAFYAGANTPASSIVEIVERNEARVLAISASMSSQIPAVCDLISTFRVSYPDSRVSILVGGTAFNASPELWREVGADAYAHDAAEAVSIASRLVT